MQPDPAPETGARRLHDLYPPAHACGGESTGGTVCAVAPVDDGRGGVCRCCQAPRVSRPRPLLHGVLAALDAQLSRLARSQGGWSPPSRRGDLALPCRHPDPAAQRVVGTDAPGGLSRSSCRLARGAPGPGGADRRSNGAHGGRLRLGTPPRRAARSALAAALSTQVEIARRAPSHGNPPAGGSGARRADPLSKRDPPPGIPLLGGAAVVADCARRELSPPDALAIADAALRRGPHSRGPGRAPGRTARSASRRAGRHGDLPRRRQGRVRPESVSRWWILEDGLPVPQLQAELDGPDGVARLDMLFPSTAWRGRRTAWGSTAALTASRSWRGRSAATPGSATCTLRGPALDARGRRQPPASTALARAAAPRPARGAESSADVVPPPIRPPSRRPHPAGVAGAAGRRAAGRANGQQSLSQWPTAEPPYGRMISSRDHATRAPGGQATGMEGRATTGARPAERPRCRRRRRP